jgi:phosphatidylserine decarboxylase
MAVEPAAGGTRIAIFLSVFDCHINRAPVAGVVTEVRYARGRYRPAYDRRAGSENERNDLVIHSEIGRFGVTQIAGLLARRIVCRKGPGDRVERGERIGMIRFGSRTDLLLPAGIAPRVAPGDRVRGGLTIMAEAQAAGALAAGGIRG